MINSNRLKIIAIVCMILDHIGYFFGNKLDYEVYFTLRCIGRIAMPIFMFSLVQGFFKTSNLKKYILRIGICAVVTEVIIRALNYINTTYFYRANIKQISFVNILFSFMLILIILRILDRKIFKDKVLDIFIRVAIILLIVIIYLCVHLDYKIYGLIIGVIMYLLEKVKMKYNNNKTMVNIFTIVIQFLVIVPLYMIAANSIIGVFSLVAFLIILLYDGKKGCKNKFVSTMFYLIYPLQYLVIYSIALIYFV